MAGHAMMLVVVPCAQIALPFLWGLPWAVWALARLRPGAGSAVLIPSSLLRYLTFKLTWDLQQARLPCFIPPSPCSSCIGDSSCPLYGWQEIYPVPISSAISMVTVPTFPHKVGLSSRDTT